MILFFDKGDFNMVYMILADGFEEIEALAVADILRRAEIEIKTFSTTENECRYSHFTDKEVNGVELNDLPR